MPVPSAEDWTKKMVDRVGVSGSDWEKGMTNARGTITSRAKAANTKWKANVQKAVGEDAFVKGINRVTDDDIVNQALKVGGGALVAGVQARQEKVAKAIAALQPKVVALKTKLDAMPTENDAQAETKAVEAIRGMRKIGRELRGLA